MGLDPSEGRRDVVGRPLSDDLADHHRSLRAVALLALGGAPPRSRTGDAGAPRLPPQPTAEWRPADVLLPVPRPGRRLLRRTAVPVRVPGALRARDRRPAAAAVRDPARRG